MPKIKIKPEKNTGNLIRSYKNNPDYSFLVLESSEIVAENGWVRDRIRTCLMRAETPILEKFQTHVSKNGLKGKITVSEFLENELPEKYEDRLNTKVEREEAIDPFIKRAGKNGPALVVEDQRILRFTDFSYDENAVDTKIQHTNIEEVAEYNKEQADSKDANLPDNKK